MAKRLPKPAPLPSDQMSQPDLMAGAERVRWGIRMLYARAVSVRSGYLGPLPEIDGDLVELRGWRPWDWVEPAEIEELNCHGMPEDE